jgi:hypothetical protein
VSCEDEVNVRMLSEESGCFHSAIWIGNVCQLKDLLTLVLMIISWSF